MAPTAVVPTITADTAMPTMKRCQLDSRLAAAPAPVMTVTGNHGILCAVASHYGNVR